MNLEIINRKILKAEHSNVKDNVLEEKLAKELLKTNHERRVKPQDKADLLTLRLSPDSEKHFTQNRLQRLKELGLSISNEELLASVIPNKHYFFLSDLREKKYTELSAIQDLAKNYNVSEEELKQLREEGFIDWPDSKDKKISTENKEDLIKRGFLSSLSPDEKGLLSSLNGQEIDTSSLLNKNDQLTEPQINRLKARGHIDVLSLKELNFLKEGGKIETLLKYNLDIQDYYRLKKRIEFHQKGEVQSIDYSGLSIKEKELIERITKNGLSELEAQASYGFSKEHVQKLAQRIERYTGKEIKDINYKIQTDLNDKFNPAAKIFYREKLPVLTFRERAEMGYKVFPSYKDISIYIRGMNQEPLSKRELDRFYELKATKDTSFVNYVPSNTELAFLRKINGRKGDVELLLKIGKDDFNLNKDSILHLTENHLISIRDGFIKNEWVEPQILTDARIWQSTSKNHSFEDSVKILAELKIQEPSSLIKALIQDNSYLNPQQSKDDYELFLKVHFKSEITYSEKERLNHLRENGIHPELNSSFIQDEPTSWNMKAARKQAFINHFKNRYQINMNVIEFVNKFKQVTHDQLLSLGLSNGEIDRYVRGIPGEKIPFGGKILNRHSLHTPKGNVIYYSIHHQGIVSGRSLLETRISKEFISQRPQQRQDLLFHDLKVVDCVLSVKSELEQKGYKILEVKNESSQYSDAKSGKSNNWRKDGPSFMDAILIVEEPINETFSISGGSKSIAVEYGNYTNERMMSKIENSDFDQAFVFSNQTFQQKYSNLVVTKNVVFRSI